MISSLPEDDDATEVLEALIAPEFDEDVVNDDPGDHGDSEAVELLIVANSDKGVITDNADGLQRHLANRQIQLIAIGGSIGTALFVSIGTGLYEGGPGSLLIAYIVQSSVLAMVNNSIAEMSTAFPVSGGFIRLAGKWVDDALGFMAGWNFFFYEAFLIPFEISALVLVTSFWNEKVQDVGPTAGICIGCIIAYAALNILAVKAYGEAEFWLSGGKVILIFALFVFTLFTMIGVNPEKDAYGFRYWRQGNAFREYLSRGAQGRFEGFLACLWSASFTVVGPEYLSIVAAEAKRPRTYIKSAFRSMYLRFGIFFIGGALAVGIVCNSRWPQLRDVVEGGQGSGTAAASPYVIAMRHLRIRVFPDIVNALMMTSIFSAGSTYTYCAIRNLYALSLEGRAPRFLSYTTNKGVPLWCVCIVMIFPFLSFLSVSRGAGLALEFIQVLVTAGGVVDYVIMSITFLRYYAACSSQRFDRRALPYYGYFQPYCAWIGLIWMSLIAIFHGYESFRGTFRARSFFGSYTILIVDVLLYFGWKIFKKTSFVKARDIDLVWERPIIDAYEATFVGPPVGFWREMVQFFGIWKVKGGNDRQQEDVIHQMSIR